MMIFLHHYILACMVLASHSQTAPPGAVPPKELVKEINVIRKEYAKEYNVPNMHELVWSDELAALPFESISNNFAYIAFTTTFVSTSIQSASELRSSFESEIDRYRSKVDHKRIIYTDKLIELLYPLQTFIACSSSEVKMFVDYDLANDFGMMCIVGPHSKTRQMFDASGESKEVPGSNCRPQFRNDDGLCVAEEPSKMSVFHGDPQEFLDDVNSVRRMYAKEYNVAFMHQLVWNESLADNANSNNEYFPKPGTTWRYVKLIYPGITETLTGEVEWFLKETASGRAHHIKQASLYYVPYLEILNPLQMQIGCAYKRLYDSFNFCLLGNSGKFELWDFDVKPTIEPGSNCSMGYVNYDGLCSIPTTTAPTTTTTTTTAAPTTTTTAPPETTVTDPPSTTSTAPSTTTTIAPLKTQPTRRPVAAPEKQTSDEKEKDSEGSEDVADSGTSIFIHLVLFFSILRFF